MTGECPSQTDFAEMALHEALPTRSERNGNVAILQSTAGSNTRVLDSRSLRQRRKRGRISKACGQCHSRKQKVRSRLPSVNFIVSKITVWGIKGSEILVTCLLTYCLVQRVIPMPQLHIPWRRESLPATCARNHT